MKTEDFMQVLEETVGFSADLIQRAQFVRSLQIPV